MIKIISTRTVKRIVAIALVLDFIAAPALAANGAPTFFGSAMNNALVPPTPSTLPGGFSAIRGMMDELTVKDNKMTVHQTEDNAIADWDSFDIGAEAWVHFDQQKRTDWKALNRIYDASPSQIYGRLTADGSVYLINQNGILFGDGSNINVHKIVASSLNLSDENFLSGTLDFDGSKNYDPVGQPDWQPDDSFVINNGTINVELTVDDGGQKKIVRDGSVFLLAPYVENSGTISAPFGQIIMAAGQGVTVTPDGEPQYQNESIVTDIDTPGAVVNNKSAMLDSYNGRISMYGRVVNQDGIIRSVTSVYHRGRIELLATDRVKTGADSQTLAPISENSEKTGEDFVHRPGEIYIGGFGSAKTPPAVVELNGKIIANSGDVQILARDRVYFAKGSVVDVSGTREARDPADQWHKVELNTAQLKNDHLLQVDSGLLYHSEVSVNEYTGSNIGDLSEAYKAEQTTSLQKAAKGGTISVQAADGDIIIQPGASFDISGGSQINGESVGVGTKLVFGGKIFDLEDAPTFLPYQAFADYYEKYHERYGITESYSGLYTGGAVPLYDRIPSHIEGYDAGRLKLISKNFLFNGSLISDLMVGPYQLYDADLFDDNGIIEIDSKQLTDRMRRPEGGTLQIGGRPTGSDSTAIKEKGSVVGEVVIVDQEEMQKIDQSILADDFSVDQKRSLKLPSYISADTISSSGIGNFIVKSNTKVVFTPDADLQMPKGGMIDIEARRIEHHGAITAPSGTVSMVIKPNASSIVLNESYEPIEERIVLASTSKIDTSGERIDNAALVGSDLLPVRGVQKAGGTIFLRDQTDDSLNDLEGLGQGDGVIIASGALLDVSGGYEITESGSLKPGDGGDIVLSGSNVVMDGSLKGYSLEGARGASISIFANNIKVVRADGINHENIDLYGPLPELDFGYDTSSDAEKQLSKGLIFAEDRLADTGFSQISLNSVYDLKVEDGVKLKVSTVKESSAAVMQQGVNATREYINVPEYEAGQSFMALNAGETLDGLDDIPFANYDLYHDNARLVVGKNSEIQVLPGGNIDLKGQDVKIDGWVKAPGGDITVRAKEGNLVISSSARLLAKGYVSPVTTDELGGLPVASQVMDAGSITLKNTSSSALANSLIIEDGAILDVSGTKEVIIANVKNNGVYERVNGAGRAGSITLSSVGKMSIPENTLFAKAYYPGMVNGSLFVEINDTNSGFVIDRSTLDVFQDNDFYQWGFASSNKIVINNDFDLFYDGKIVFDTPLLVNENGAKVSIGADWLQLRNTYLPNNLKNKPIEKGDGLLNLYADFIDVQGSVQVTGVDSVGLFAGRDMSFSDYLYSDGDSKAFYQGDFIVPGNMKLQADRIYATSFSDVTIQAAERMTILPGDGASDGLIYSAAANLTLKANKLDHQGYLAAPLGSISLIGIGENSRVMLSPGSISSVSGQDGSIEFGSLDDKGEFWTYLPKEYGDSGQNVDVNGAPAKNLVLEGDEVIVRENSRMDLSGGGSIFSYKFLPGLEGTIDPLLQKGQYVVVPNLKQPGMQVQLDGSAFLPAGTFTILPLDKSHADNAKYAFLPGAVILTDKGDFTSNMPGATVEGYQMVQGYLGVNGHQTDNRIARGFAIRPADDVINEGFFQRKEFVGGDGGSFELKGKQTTVTSILEGAVNARALQGFKGGTFKAAAKIVEIGAESSGLSQKFSIDDDLPTDFQGKLNIKDSTLTGNGFSKIIVGDTDISRRIIVKKGSKVSAENVYLNVGSGDLGSAMVAAEITVENGAEIHAVQPEVGGSGYSETVFTTDDNDLLAGTVTLKDGSLAHAADNITFDTDNLVLDGADSLQVDNSSLTLRSSRIVFSKSGATANDDLGGLNLQESQWLKFDNIEDIYLDSATDILFAGDFKLKGNDRVVFDAQRIGGYDEDGVSEVSFSSPWLTLKNSKTTYDESKGKRFWLSNISELGTPEGSSLRFIAENGLTLGPGDIRVEGFADIGLETKGDLALTGQAYQGKDERNNDIYTASAFRAAKNLNITAARLTLNPLMDGKFKAADYQLSVDNILDIKPAAGAGGGKTLARGGRLKIQAGTINQGGVIDTVSSSIEMVADTINIDGTIRSIGSEITPAGNIKIIVADKLNLTASGKVDLSAGSQGDAGSLDIMAPEAELTLAGQLTAKAKDGGRGGSFKLDAKELSGGNGSTDFDTLNDLLASGGFNEAIDVRSRTGDIVLGSGKSVVAKKVKLSADDNAAGNIKIYGSIDAGGDDGGTVELYAWNDVELYDNSVIKANTYTALGDGGQVLIASQQGFVNFNEGAEIDVSSGAASSIDNGVVKFRARRNAANNAARMDLQGTIKGAGKVESEAFSSYNYSQISNTQLNQMKSQTKSFLDAQTWVLDNLKFSNPLTVTLAERAGIEVVSEADLSLNTDWNLATWLGNNYEPVNVTMRAATDLNINRNIIDKRTSSKRDAKFSKYFFFTIPTDGNYGDAIDSPSANITLAAGADLHSANPLAIGNSGSGSDVLGNLNIANQKKIYTETGDIRFASAADTTIGISRTADTTNDPTPWQEAKLKSTLASYRGNIQGVVGGTLISKGVIQTASGDINLSVGKDLILSNPDEISGELTGAIRTTGLPSSTITDGSGYAVTYLDFAGNEADYITMSVDPASTDMKRFYDYDRGGNIKISAANDISGGMTLSGENWDKWWSDENRWSASYADSRGDTATLGIATMAGGDIRVAAQGNIDLQIGAFRQGSLLVTSGSDINGRYLVSDGTGDIYAQGSFGSLNDAQHLELMKGQVNLTAEGNINLGRVLNPSYELSEKYMGYSVDSTVKLTAINQDVSISGKAYSSASADVGEVIFLPPNITVNAGRDIVFTTMAELMIAPAPTADLKMVAGRDIYGIGMTDSNNNPLPSVIKMRQDDPAYFYAIHEEPISYTAPSAPLQKDDVKPVTLSAGRDIRNIRLLATKKAEITAGKNISDLVLQVQNINEEDLTIVQAGADILMGSYERSANATTGFSIAGPGTAVVMAQGEINLGTTAGIRSIANGGVISDNVHPYLAYNGADVYVLSGIEEWLGHDEVDTFFSSLRDYGEKFSVLMAAGDVAEARAVEEMAREELFTPLFGEAHPQPGDGVGNISMTQSSIATVYGGNVNILASGLINIGGTSFTQRNSSSGIRTEAGGEINIYSVGDVNVNESRLMTWMGGNITVWADGDINAGRGSKTAVNASGVAVARVNEKGVFELQKKPTVGGSGIRAVTYDPDGSGGIRDQPEAGDIYLFAPNGTIDAGEAGIAGRKIIIYGNEVLNAGNFEYSESGVGVPVAADTGMGLGAISGAGAVAAATSEASKTAVALDSVQEQSLASSDLGETLVAKLLKVEVIDLSKEF